MGTHKNVLPVNPTATSSSRPPPNPLLFLQPTMASTAEPSTPSTHRSLGTGRGHISISQVSKLRLCKALLGPKSRISGSYTEAFTHFGLFF